MYARNFDTMYDILRCLRRSVNREIKAQEIFQRPGIRNLIKSQIVWMQKAKGLKSPKIEIFE